MMLQTLNIDPQLMPRWGSVERRVLLYLRFYESDLQIIEIVSPLRFFEMAWDCKKLMHPLPQWFSRYSHTAHVVDDKLILVGGVTTNSSHSPGIVILNLESLKWNSFTLPVGFYIFRSQLLSLYSCMRDFFSHFPTSAFRKPGPSCSKNC